MTLPIKRVTLYKHGLGFLSDVEIYLAPNCASSFRALLWMTF